MSLQTQQYQSDAPCNFVELLSDQCPAVMEPHFFVVITVFLLPVRDLCSILRLSGWTIFKRDARRYKRLFRWFPCSSEGIREHDLFVRDDCKVDALAGTGCSLLIRSTHNQSVPAAYANICLSLLQSPRFRSKPLDHEIGFGPATENLLPRGVEHSCEEQLLVTGPRCLDIHD